MTVKKQGDEMPAQSSSAKSILHGMQLLLVQSSLCLVILAFVFVVKMIDGTAFASVREHFKEGMYEHSLLFVPSATKTTVTAEPQTTTTVSEVGITPDAVSVSGSATQIAAPLIGGIITSPYGSRTDPITGEEYDYHHGLDIAADKDTPLHALLSGEVVEVGYEENGYGRYVIVKCTPQHSYLYAHCEAITVTEGQSVNVGEVIARVGSTGRSTGNHLHIEWRENGKAVDPMTVLPKETYA